MADHTAIEWTDATFNAWVGCTKVSPACDRCYAEGWAKRTGHPELWAGERRRTTPGYWRQPDKWNRAAAAAGVRKRVFCCSLADVFDNQVPPLWRADLWQLIRDTPSLDWQILTKRPQNIRKMLPLDWGGGYPNVWMGTTAENQEEAERRIPHLMAIPAAVWFLSIEPTLGPIILPVWGQYEVLGVDWVICGGESGPGWRDMNPDWARALRDQCRSQGVPFFFKQMAGKRPIPDDLLIREFPA